MWSSLSFQIGQLLLQPHCPLCGPAWAAPKEESPSPCSHCRKQFDLPSQPLQGDAPLPWMAVGHYSGTLRRLILHLRKGAHDHPIRCLSDSLQQALPAQAILIPIPSWKQTSQVNRLPERIANVLNRPRAPLLARSRAVVGQHRLHQDAAPDRAARPGRPGRARPRRWRHHRGRRRRCPARHPAR